MSITQTWIQGNAITPSTDIEPLPGGDVKVTISWSLSQTEIAALLFTACGYTPADIAQAPDAERLLVSVLTGTTPEDAMRTWFGNHADRAEELWELACRAGAIALSHAARTPR